MVKFRLQNLQSDSLLFITKTYTEYIKYDMEPNTLIYALNEVMYHKIILIIDTIFTIIIQCATWIYMLLGTFVNSSCDIITYQVEKKIILFI